MLTCHLRYSNPPADTVTPFLDFMQAKDNIFNTSKLRFHITKTKTQKLKTLGLTEKAFFDIFQEVARAVPGSIVSDKNNNFYINATLKNNEDFTLFKKTLAKILKNKGLEQYSNICKLINEEPTSKESPEYKYSLVIEISLFKKMNLITEFNFYNILSLSDGFSLCKGIGPDQNIKIIAGTAYSLACTFGDSENPKKIIATSQILEASNLLAEFNINTTINHTEIKHNHLNNQYKFTEQGINSKFDFIIMREGLCLCENGKIKNNVSCGGINMAIPGKLTDFLLNVSSVLNSATEHPVALLLGDNPIENPNWKAEVNNFNEQQDVFESSILRDIFGIFTGIIIQKKGCDYFIEEK